MPIAIKLTAFEGPLDLLLHLIDKHQIDIYDIPIAAITDQYLDYMRDMVEDRMDGMSAFIEMAATLIKIKSKMLLPIEVEEATEQDPRQELVDKLLAYKQFKQVAEILKSQQEAAGKWIFKGSSLPSEVLNVEVAIDPVALLQEVPFDKLYQVFRDVLKKKEDKIDPIRSSFGEIKREVFTVDDKIQMVFEMCNHYETFEFVDLLNTQNSKEEVIATFLAILEMMKMGVIEIRQEGLFEAIIIVFVGRKHEHEHKDASD